MNGLIAAYRLTDETGRKIARVKGMPLAWSDPVFLPSFLRNIGPFLLYDQLYLDNRSYSDLLSQISPDEAHKLSQIVENDKMNLFTLINAEEVLADAEGDVFQVEQGYNALHNDIAFSGAVADISNKLGFYARPSPLRFEAMNIPVIELLADKWTKKIGSEFSIVDQPHRVPLYAISWQKQLQNTFAPMVAAKIIELAPKVLPLVPSKPELDADTILRLREDSSIEGYRKKVWEASKRASKAYQESLEKYLSGISHEEDSDAFDATRTIEKVSAKISDELYLELVDAWKSLTKNTAVDGWTIFGGVVTVASALAKSVYPEIPTDATVALGVGNGGIVLGHQAVKAYSRRELKWVEFLQLVGEEANRPR